MRGDKKEVVPLTNWMDFYLWHQKCMFFILCWKCIQILFKQYQTVQKSKGLDLRITGLWQLNLAQYSTLTVRPRDQDSYYVINSTCTSTFLIFAVHQWKRRWHCHRHSQARFTAGIFQLREQLSASLVRLKWGSRRVWDSHGSIDLPWPPLSWRRPPSATGKGEADYK